MLRGDNMMVEHRSDHCMTDALNELLKFQQFIQDYSIPYFGKLLGKIVGTDTIPIMLQTEDGFLQLMGIDKKGDKHPSMFFTRFFRIEEVDIERNCAIVTLLRSLNIDGEDTDQLCDMVKLVKTNICETIDLSSLYGVQPLDPAYLRRKIIIEPKW